MISGRLTSPPTRSGASSWPPTTPPGGPPTTPPTTPPPTPPTTPPATPPSTPPSTPASAGGLLDGGGTFSGICTGCTGSVGWMCGTSFGTSTGFGAAGAGGGGGGGGGGGAVLTNTTLIGGSSTGGTFQYCANSRAPPATTWMISAIVTSHQRRVRRFMSRSIREFSNMISPVR